MNLTDVTTSDILTAVERALESMEGANMYTPGPYPFELKPLAEPMTVIYYGADGNTYERTVELEMQGDTLNAVLGDRREVEAQTLWVPVEGGVNAAFSFDAGSFGERKKWTGLIFRAGNYPDKGCEVTPEDLRAIVASFPDTGVPVMSEHEDSLIGEAMQKDGARLVRVWTEKGDTELHGEIDAPGWLAYGLREITKRVSVGLSASKQMLREISLVLSPRVADAAVFAQRAAYAFSHSPAFNDLQRTKPDRAAALMALGRKATPPAPAPARTEEENETMNFADKVRKGVALLTPQQRDELGLTDALINDPANFAAAPKQAHPRDVAFARLKAEKEFDVLLSERKVLPSMRDNFIRTFTSLLKAEGGGEIKFSSGGDIEIGDEAKAFLAMCKDSKPQFSIGERISSDPGDEQQDDDPVLAVFTAAGAQGAGRKGAN